MFNTIVTIESTTIMKWLEKDLGMEWNDLCNYQGEWEALPYRNTSVFSGLGEWSAYLKDEELAEKLDEEFPDELPKVSDYFSKEEIVELDCGAVLVEYFMEQNLPEGVDSVTIMG